MWVLKNSKDLLYSTWNQCHSPLAIALNIWLLCPLHKYSTLKTKRKIKRISPTL